MFLKHPRSRFQAGKTARQPSTERANRAVRISEQYLDQLSDDLRVTTRRKRDDYSHFDRIANDASRPLRDRDIARYRRDQAEEDFQAMERLLAEIEEHWQGDEDTTLGRLLCCPPVGYGVGSQGRTEDWALIKIDPDKLPSNEYGPLANLLDLTGKYESRVVHRVPGGSVTWGGMLRLQGLLTQADIIHGPINVLMRGAIGGIAKGYLMPVDSMVKPAFARRHGRQKSQEQGKYEGWSREWAAMPPIPRRCEVLPGPFARPGDSGAGVVAEDGRIGGIVTCASGTPPTRLGASANKDVPGRERGEVDITYVTPMHHLLERFVAHGVKDPQFL
ncbi:hypothetical protein I316_07693 [Kwoniella heveanensis BCC8398]|uniref:Uncharacterized protein n=1 Tax=Kwoniella heveanensis BCC8398 TaxID=1296120 RepID=A0A1B9GI20_9TREE|nr:hypothetical protein I316_07693 [Kwoniella heveanensis BCC8398]